MFRPESVPQVLTIPGGGLCLVFDDILLEPDRWRSRAAEFAAQFEPPKHNAYPGRELRLPDTVTTALLRTVSPWLNRHFGVTRIQDAYTRLSMVTLAPEQLTPAQSLCHRDRLQAKPGMLPLASVLYLFDEPALGGTHFFRPRVEDAALMQLLVDSNRMEAALFFQHYGVARGYMTDSNAYFEKVLTVPARRNRMIVYPGMKFHSGDISHPELLSEDPLTGRLTFNGFFTGTMA
jgi:hypothetical protein